MGGLTPLLWTILVAGIALPATDAGGGRVGARSCRRFCTGGRSFWVFGLIGVMWCAAVRPLVSRSARGKSARQRGRTGDDPPGGDEPAADRPRPLGTHAGQPQPLAAVPHVRRPELWLVLLHHLLPKFLEQNLGVPVQAWAGRSARAGRCGWARSAALPAACSPTASSAARATAAGAAGLPASSATRSPPFASSLASPYVRGPRPLVVHRLISLAGFSTDLAMGRGLGRLPRHRQALRGGRCRLHEHDRQLLRFAGRHGLRLFSPAVARRPRPVPGPQRQSLAEAQKAAGLWNGYQMNFLIAAACTSSASCAGCGSTPRSRSRKRAEQPHFSNSDSTWLCRRTAPARAPARETRSQRPSLALRAGIRPGEAGFPSKPGPIGPRRLFCFTIAARGGMN